MRVFKEPNTDIEFVCPICKTSDIKPVTLVGIVGTEEGNNMKAIQVHIDCLQLVMIDDKETGKKVIFHTGEID